MNLHFVLLTEVTREKKKKDRSSKNQERIRKAEMKAFVALLKARLTAAKDIFPYTDVGGTGRLLSPSLYT